MGGSDMWSKVVVEVWTTCLLSAKLKEGTRTRWKEETRTPGKEEEAVAELSIFYLSNLLIAAIRTKCAF
jgi:hypothetical protein